jgi:GWxTD domain-containing protein
MMKKRLLSLGLVLVCLGAHVMLGQEKLREEELPARFQEFLILTRYIILPQEKEVFMQLTSDSDRDAFVRTFWKQRDPTPGTPQNERKEEHIRRFNHANKTFRRQTVRPGWMTDMGRFYIMLGEPTSYERIPSSLDLYPIEIWYFHGDVARGQPTYFALVFFQRGGTGEYKLYDPISDGPAALMVYGRHFNPSDYEGMYQYLLERVPTLALVSLSMVPGDIPFNWVPSALHNIMLAEIIDSVKKDVNPTYATNFLEYKAMVSTEYMENFVESTTELAFIRDPLMDINFLHFSIVPEEISIDYYEPDRQYFCNFSLTVNLKKDERIIFQYTREFPLYFKEEDLSHIQGNGIAIEDSFPMIDGQFNLTILLQNSVGKEFTVFEKVVSAPEDSGRPGIMRPLLGYRTQNFRRDLHIPFKVLEHKVVIDPKYTFAAAENISFLLNVSNVTQSLWENGKLRVEIKGLKPVDPTVKAFDVNLRNIPTLDQKKTGFTVSTQAVLAHPIAQAKAFPLSRNYLYFFSLAHQAEEIQNWDLAEEIYQRAHGANPEYKQGVVDYANFLFKIEKFDRSIELIERLRDDTEMRFQYFLIKGRAFMGRGQYQEAVDSLLQGNEIYDSDTGLLNSLGICYNQLGERRKALDALNASLRLNPAQEEVKTLIAEIEKK